MWGVWFFWLNYRYPEGQFAGAVVIEATALIIARMQAAVSGSMRDSTLLAAARSSCSITATSVGCIGCSSARSCRHNRSRSGDVGNCNEKRCSVRRLRLEWANDDPAKRSTRGHNAVGTVWRRALENDT